MSEYERDAIIVQYLPIAFLFAVLFGIIGTLFYLTG